jgi:hypothetical protein
MHSCLHPGENKRRVGQKKFFKKKIYNFLSPVKNDTSCGALTFNNHLEFFFYYSPSINHKLVIFSLRLFCCALAKVVETLTMKAKCPQLRQYFFFFFKYTTFSYIFKSILVLSFGSLRITNMLRYTINSCYFHTFHFFFLAFFFFQNL